MRVPIELPGAKRAAVNRGVADRAVAADGAAGVDGEGGAGDRAIHRHRAGADRGGAGVAAVAGEGERAGAGLAQRAGAGDGCGQGERVGEVRDDLAFVGDRRRIDRAGQSTGAEIERAALGDAGEAGRVDHAAVGDSERSDQRTTTAAGTPDRQRVGRVQNRPSARDDYVRAAVSDIADGGGRGRVDDGAVGNREQARPAGAAAADAEADPPTFQVEPGPVTVAVGVPRMESISAPPWLLSTPPLLMESVAGPKMPMPVKPFTVTLEPVPLMIMLLATRRSLATGVSPTCSVAPLMTREFRLPPSRPGRTR